MNHKLSDPCRAAFQDILLRNIGDNIVRDNKFRHSRDVMSANFKELKSIRMGTKKRKADLFTAEEINILYEKELLGAEKCEEGGIHGRKTNHSVRKTAITALVHEDIPDTRIMQLSGNKKVQSIYSYSSASIEQQKEMSNILSKIGTGKITSDKNPRPLEVINNNDIPSDDDAKVVSASQEAELSLIRFERHINF
ncbi:unnamed protein product [Mytilus coruscus]|uniref:Tyr recombinase domain-containing protein n=1 Tax=Mytilus coruscus TaxID=42192 RepID=A0A6J8D2U5_MYTCO|nr:unnamed protein product [Mytilus coruscus]